MPESCASGRGEEDRNVTVARFAERLFGLALDMSSNPAPVEQVG
jgi:hypothetical protein